VFAFLVSLPGLDALTNLGGFLAVVNSRLFAWVYINACATPEISPVGDLNEEIMRVTGNNASWWATLDLDTAYPTNFSKISYKGFC